MIDKSEIEVLVYRDDTTTEVDSAVRLTHRPTGIVVESSEHGTQTGNYDAALEELERRVDEVGGTQPLRQRLRRWIGRFSKPS